ncbi:MAG: Spy/CpxP family protein refolding chaperone, partial [Gammaproteobacteria bacterium]|nr:Spy/CpxP family protein refolding chaperone [Gammaproteobacteria bacterium]
AIAGTLAACGHGWSHRSPEEKADWLVGKVAKKMDLNESQVQKLNIVKTELLALKQSMKQRHDENHAELKAMLSSNVLDEQKMSDMVKGHTQAIDEATPAVVAAFSSFYASLNDDQRAKLNAFMAEHSEKSKRHSWM